MSVHSTVFSTTILGSNSALPAFGRNPTAQLLNVNNHYYLIDCGEGTQMQLRRFGIKMQRIKVVFISHLHGDHYFGLIGLLNSMHLLGRTQSITIVGPKDLKQILDLQMDVAHGKLQFEIKYVFTDFIEKEKQLHPVYSDNEITVCAFPLKHRILCSGFLFTEQEKDLHFKAEMIQKFDIPVHKIPEIKKGADLVLEDGTVIPNSQLTYPPQPPRSYAFCTDTAPQDYLKKLLHKVDLLYHESTFTEEHADRAKKTFHSTASQAAEIANGAEVGKLLLGHYSARYKDLEEVLHEAQAIFKESLLTIEGEEYHI